MFSGLDCSLVYCGYLLIRVRGGPATYNNQSYIEYMRRLQVSSVGVITRNLNVLQTPNDRTYYLWRHFALRICTFSLLLCGEFTSEAMLTAS